MPGEAEVRDEIRSWLAGNWDPDLPLGEWWGRLADSGWAVPTWPEQWLGRGLSSELASVVGAELRAAGAPGPPAGLGLMLAGPTIIAHGSDELKHRHLRAIVSGEEAWCQLFSEPGAGSDLASIQTRAERDGEEWVVTGQKVWTSGAQLADFGMLLARTDPDAPKHKGITYFALAMDQPGVDVRPLREMTGRAFFSEVFFDEARVPHADIVGDLHGGWPVALTTLAHERVSLGGGGSGLGSAMPGRKSRALQRRAGDVAVRSEGRAAAALTSRNTEAMVALARDRGRTNDPVVRQQLARLYSLNEINRYTSLRSKAAVAQGRRPGPEASTGKLSISQITRAAREVGLCALGAHGMLSSHDAPDGGAIHELTVFSPAVSIYGGTDEIQKKIIGERVLGLPKEPEVDRDVPFRELRVGTQRRQE